MNFLNLTCCISLGVRTGTSVAAQSDAPGSKRTEPDDEIASIADTIFSESSVLEQLPGSTPASTLVRSTASMGHVSHGALGITFRYKKGRFLTQFFTDQLDPLIGPDGVSMY